MTDRSERAERRRILRRRNPFASVSVGDPLDAAADDRFPDVPSINETAFAAIRDLILQKTDRPSERFAVMVLGEVGEGKTHLMARLRRHSRAADPPFSFAYIQPIEDPERPFGYLLREWVANLCIPDAPGRDDAPIDALMGAVFREVIEAEIFKRLPDGASLEVFMDCCHSGWDTGPIGTTSPYSAPYTAHFGRGPAAAAPEGAEPVTVPRYVEPPEDIQFRWLGEEDRLGDTRGFTGDTRSTAKHIIWAGPQPDQTSADAYINADYHGAFTYYYCQHMRETKGEISRRELLERVRSSLRYNNYRQIPQLECGDPDALIKRPLQFPAMAESERLLFLTTPNMRGRDVAAVQQALKDQGYDIEADGVFGPYTRVVVMKFQERNNMLVDGVVGPAVRGVLFR